MTVSSRVTIDQSTSALDASSSAVVQLSESVLNSRAKSSSSLVEVNYSVSIDQNTSLLGSLTSVLGTSLAEVASPPMITASMPNSNTGIKTTSSVTGNSLWKFGYNVWIELFSRRSFIKIFGAIKHRATGFKQVRYSKILRLAEENENFKEVKV